MTQVTHMPDDTLLDFAYGELSEDLVSTVSAHVASCAQCAAAVASIRGVRTTMAKLPVETAPEAGLDSLLSYADLAARRNAQPAKRATPWWAKLLPVAVSLSVLAVVGGIGLQVSKSMPDPLTSVSLKQRPESPAPARAAESATAKLDVELYGSAEASGSGSPVNLSAMKGESKQKVRLRAEGAQVVKRDQPGPAAGAVAASPQVAEAPAAPMELADAKDERLKAKESDDAYAGAVAATAAPVDQDFESRYGASAPAKVALRNDAPRPLAKLESATAGARPPPAASPIAEARTTSPSVEAKKAKAQVPDRLELARRARSLRDWNLVMHEATKVLSSVRGDQREATLALLCEAATELAQTEFAAKYCGLLEKEFPKNAAP